MTKFSLAFFFLLPLLTSVPTTLGRPVIGQNDKPVASTRLLSRDLVTTLQDTPRDIASAALGLQQHILKISSVIEEVAALDDDSPVSKRAAAACKIANLIFPGRVFAANDPEYQLEQDFNWYDYSMNDNLAPCNAC